MIVSLIVARRSLLAIIFVSSVLLAASTSGRAVADEWSFEIRAAGDVHQQPFSGRVYLFFSKNIPEPRMGPNWFVPELFIAQDVENWNPGEPLTFSSQDQERLLAFPVPLSQMKLAGYRAQAVVRFNPHERKIGTGPGNAFSRVVVLEQRAANSKRVTFIVDQVVQPRAFRETKWTKLLQVRSEKLSRFYGRDVFINATVTLPASYYSDADRRYPTMFSIPGFGGTHVGRNTGSPIVEKNERGVEFLRVRLDPSCPLGHHVFADSANNGPVGSALVEGFLPEYDATVRSIAEPGARFLTGHSSGGWSSLWLQVTYPETFGGTWSTSPDPVDFRDFQRINLYQPDENMYVDADGRRRPIARRGERVLVWYQSFAEMEATLGPGGQLHSFEAAFSPRGPDGKPLLIWNRKTGAVNADVARTWEKYDIRLVLERNWPELGPLLKGKLHLFMGDADTFYLEGATVLLKESLEELGSDAVVEIHAGKDHGTILGGGLRGRIRREMTETFLANFPDYQ